MANSEENKRRSKLREILNLISDRSEFRRREIQFLCRESRPAFVTRVLNQLAHEGYLNLTQFGDDHHYAWRSETNRFVVEEWIERQVTSDQVTQIPSEERPRERLLNDGVASLKTSEILAILIRSGIRGESAVQGGQRLANHVAGHLEKLPELSHHEMKQISKAISITAYCQIMAGIELGRRVAERIGAQTPKQRINSTTAAVEFCKRHFSRLASEGCQEEFHIVTLDTKLQPIQSHQITVGTLDASLVHPREVFRPAIRDAASSILLVHNHPSGDPTPSRQDRDVTDRLKRSGELLGITVIDHIVVAKGNAVSLAEVE